jgi:hypothetical protein
LDATWKKIYDYAYRGDGACGFKAFKAALENKRNAALDEAVLAVAESSGAAILIRQLRKP